MATRRTYTVEEKASAIARVLAGEEVAAVARDTGINRTAIQKWLVRPVSPGGVTVAEGVTELVTTHKPSLMGLIGDYLEANLGAMRNQATRLGERAWIEKAPTADILSAHDILGRRLVGVLDRLHPKTGPEPEPEE